jgi:hypothetical protein
MVVKAFPASFLQAPMARVSTARALPVQGLTASVLTVLVLTIQALDSPLVRRPLLTTLTPAVAPQAPSRYQLSPLDKGRGPVPDGSEICRRKHPCQRRRDSPGAQRQLWEVAHIVVEPGGATDLAALASGKYRPRRWRAGRGAAVRSEHRCGGFRAVISVL